MATPSPRLLAARGPARCAAQASCPILPWLSALRIAAGRPRHEVVDISRTGVLIETPTKLASWLGASTSSSSGPGLELRVPARMLRTNVAGVDSLGVRYRVAAAFSRALEMPGLVPSGQALQVECVDDDHRACCRACSSAVSPRTRRAIRWRAFEAGAAAAAARRATSQHPPDARSRCRTPGPSRSTSPCPRARRTPPVLQVSLRARAGSRARMEFRVLQAAAGVAAALVLSPDRTGGGTPDRVTGVVGGRVSWL